MFAQPELECLAHATQPSLASMMGRGVQLPHALPAPPATKEGCGRPVSSRNPKGTALAGTR
eukprot:3324201-Prorocentrum_lima.AAC.1